MSPRSGALLAVLACLAASASAALAPFANAGGPPFLNGALFTFNETTQKPVSVGLIINGTMSFALPIPEGGVQSLVGTYTSWECGAEPGEYRAMLDYVRLKGEGATAEVTERKTVCEFGRISFSDMVNTWAWNETACPTETDEVDFFFDTRNEATLACGEATGLLKDLALPSGPEVAVIEDART